MGVYLVCMCKEAERRRPRWFVGFCSLVLILGIATAACQQTPEPGYPRKATVVADNPTAHRLLVYPVPEAGILEPTWDDELLCYIPVGAEVVLIGQLTYQIEEEIVDTGKKILVDKALIVVEGEGCEGAIHEKYVTPPKPLWGEDTQVGVIARGE